MDLFAGRSKSVLIRDSVKESVDSTTLPRRLRLFYSKREKLLPSQNRKIFALWNAVE
jgi:hypothetical protein